MRAAGMPGARVTAGCLLIGVAIVQWWPRLPAPAACALAALAGVGLALRWPRLGPVAIVLSGIAWAVWRGTLALALRLPPELQWRNLEVTGVVHGLPQAEGDASRFLFDIDGAALGGHAVPFHGRVRLAWYQDPPRLAACSRWRLKVRLHRPRGLLDPGAADGERSALQRRLGAVGYVRADAGNRELATARCLDGLRSRLAERIDQRIPDAHDAALVRALGLGDTRGLDADDWDVARADGVSHLLAISGFHVGMAALFGVALVRLGYGWWPGLGLRLPRPPAQAVAALAAAGGYAALAGFGLPTMRTLCMVAVVTLARCRRRHATGMHTLCLALTVLLLADPLAVLSAGFWLSFVGVALLMLFLEAPARGVRGFLAQLTAAQLLMSVALLPLTLWFFGQASLIGALANLVAVPLVSLVVVPVVLAGVVLLLLAPAGAGPVLRLAAWVMHLQWSLLARMATWPGAHWYLPEVHPAALGLAMLGALWLFAPRGVPLRVLGLVLFLPLLRPPLTPPAAGGFHAWVLDVGQGLAVVVRTRHHALVYDTGPRYPSGFDLGEAVVVPALHALGIGRLDLLVVSHADNDHAGGARSVADAFPQAMRLSGEPARMPVPMRACRAGQAWQWDGVRLRVAWPTARDGRATRNDGSCVLVVEGAGGRLVLTGDISSRVEPAVAAAVGDGPSTVLLVPHHGSRHSSSPAFIAAMDPGLAVVSAGWHNRFGHPHPDVLGRYAIAGVPVVGTAALGAIRIDVPPAGRPRLVLGWRRYRPRYWRE